MLKRILLFDVNRILFFDINRVLRWDISRAVIPAVLFKAVLGFVAAGFVLAVVVPMATQNGWRIDGWVPPAVILGCVLAAVASDLRQAVGSRRRRA